MKAGRGGAAVVTSNVEHEGIPFGPEDLEGVVEAALRYQRAEGDLARANGAYSLAIMLQPANPRLYAERSSVRWKLGQQQAARDDVRVVRTLAGVDADAWERRDASIQAAISRMPVAEISDLQGDAFARVDWPGPVARIQDVDPREGEHVYGLRFVTPEAPAKLVWAFVPPEGLANWYILPATGIMRGFDSFEKHEGEVNLGGQRQRKVADLQSLHQTYLEPRAEYAIYFGFKDDAPRRLWYTIGLIPQ